MDRSILIRGSIIMGLFLIIIGAAVGCSLIKSDAVEPSISNGNDVYLTLDDFTITNQQLWEVMKSVDGLEYLMNYVDKIILEDYINEVTQEEVDEEVLFLTYSSDSAEYIAKIQEDPELDADYVNAFRQNLIILGFDPDNTADVRSSVEVSIAKYNMAKDFVRSATGEDKYALDDENLKDYYDSVTFGDSCVIEVRFGSANEANLVFDNFNLVPNFNSGFGKYFGTIAIEDVPTDEFTLENTTQLNDDEVFLEFVGLYNYMNPWATQLPTDITEENYCVSYSDTALFVYDDMIKDRSSSDPYVQYSSYIFNTLSLEEGKVRYSYTTQKLGDGVLIAFKVSQEETVAYEDLSALEVEELREEVLKVIVSSDVINDIMNTKRDEVGFEIFDPYLALKYGFETSTTFNNKGSKSVVAVFGDLEITADDLFAFMEERVGTFYSIEITKVQRILFSNEYIEVYGDDHDYMNNKSDKMVAHRTELRNMKQLFSNNQYASYGFSSAVYSWEEFLYLAFSAKSDGDVIEQLFVVGNLQPRFIYPTLNYNSVAEYISNQVTNYFSLGVEHLLMYVDFDKDFAPDDFKDLRAEFTPEELSEYSALKVAFENLVFAKTTVGKTFAQIVTEFEDSLIDDVENEWAPFKQYGFNIITEILTTKESLTNANSSNLDDTFAASLKRIYDAYVLAEAVSVTDTIASYLDTQLTVSSFGIHLIKATKGTAFVQPTALYNDVDNDYSNGADNTSRIPSESQVALYNQIRYAEVIKTQTDVMLPSSVYQAIEAYYGPMYNAHFTPTGYSLVTTSYMLNSNPVYNHDTANKVSNLQNILDVLYLVNFPEGFNVIPE